MYYLLRRRVKVVLMTEARIERPPFAMMLLNRKLEIEMRQIESMVIIIVVSVDDVGFGFGCGQKDDEEGKKEFGNSSFSAVHRRLVGPFDSEKKKAEGMIRE